MKYDRCLSSLLPVREVFIDCGDLTSAAVHYGDIIRMSVSGGLLVILCSFVVVWGRCVMIQ